MSEKILFGELGTGEIVSVDVEDFDEDNKKKGTFTDSPSQKPLPEDEFGELDEDDVREVDAPVAADDADSNDDDNNDGKGGSGGSGDDNPDDQPGTVGDPNGQPDTLSPDLPNSGDSGALLERPEDERGDDDSDDSDGPSGPQPQPQRDQ